MMTPFDIQDARGSAFGDELKLIPRWSLMLAGLAFLAMQYFHWVVLPSWRHHPGPPFGLRLYFALSWGALAALYVIMIGYVSNDAPRRSMSLGLWIFVCLVLPGGIGSVLYFMLRQPVVATCPACGSAVQGEFHFCPQCSYQISAACGNCHRAARPTDLYCVRCGHDLAVDNTPARLRAFTS